MPAANFWLRVVVLKVSVSLVPRWVVVLSASGSSCISRFMLYGWVLNLTSRLCNWLILLSLRHLASVLLNWTLPCADWGQRYEVVFRSGAQIVRMLRCIKNWLRMVYTAQLLRAKII